MSRFKRFLFLIIDKGFLLLTDDKSYSELELENYKLRLIIEDISGEPDYWREGL